MCLPLPDKACWAIICLLNAGCVPAWFCDDPLHQTVADFLDWYWTSNEDEQDGYGNLTVNAKLKRTVTALGNSVEFVAGVGLGISTGFEFSKYINVEAGLYYDLIRVEYIDGRFTAYQYAYEGITANFFFISSGSPRELYRPISSYPTKWQPYESVEKMSYGVSAYLFGGGTFAVNWDVLGLLNDLDEIWR